MYFWSRTIFVVCAAPALACSPPDDSNDPPPEPPAVALQASSVSENAGVPQAEAAAPPLPAPAAAADPPSPEPIAFVWQARSTAESILPADAANPFRGRIPPSAYTATESTQRRYYERSTDLLAVSPALRSILWVNPADPADGFTDLVDPFPAELDDFWDTDPYSTAPFDSRFPANQSSSNPNQKFGGDYSGKIGCVAFDPTPGSPYTRQIDGTEKHAGCIPFTNIRVIGGRGELPLRPAPDWSHLFTPVDAEVAQGLAFPPPAASEYERRVDPATGRPLVATGSEIPDGSGVWASANRDPHSYRSMTQAGVCRAPECLKPGGAAGQLNQNGFTVARDDDGEVTYVRVDGFGNPIPGPGSTVFSDGTYEFITKLVTVPCTTPDEFSDCEPERYEVGLVDGSFNGELFADGWSPQNALEHHPADQGVFACICDATLPFLPGIDPGACTLDLFSSPGPIVNVGTADFPPFAEVIACVMAGEIGFGCQNYMNLITKNLSGIATPPIRESGIVPLNRDASDGLITATSAAINRDSILTLASPLDRQLLALLKFTPGPEDMLTLDSSSTNAQRALLGCGPFYGTRCDTSVKAKTTTIFGLQANPCRLVGIGCTEGGGIDLLNAEAGALFHASVASPAADLSDPWYTSNPQHPEYARWAAGGSNFVGTPWEGDGIWLTTSGLPQPGTIEFPGGPACTRYDPDLGETVVLPGCRGINKVLNRATAKTVQGYIGFRFDDGYDPAVDGCVLGATIDGLPVKGFYADKTPVDLSLCNQSTHKIGGFYVWDAGSTDASHPQQSLPKLVDWGGGALEKSQTRMSRPGAGTLWHPFAGCFADPGAAVGSQTCIQVPKSGVDVVNTLPQYAALKLRLAQGNGTKLPMETPRDFEGDFFETDINIQSQIFRSEIAALSFNFMQFLIHTSCDGDEDDVENDPTCFDPRQQFVVGKCSYATPQLCRSFKQYRGLTLPIPAEESAVPAACVPPNAPPDCSEASADREELWPPNHKFSEVTVSGVTDPDGDPVAIRITSISQDEPLDGTGDGNSCPDGDGVGSGVAGVRVERSGSQQVPGDGRVYHIGFAADDGHGGSCEGRVTVCVPHDQRPGHACVDQGPRFDSTRCGP